MPYNRKEQQNIWCKIPDLFQFSVAMEQCSVVVGAVEKLKGCPKLQLWLIIQVKFSLFKVIHVVVVKREGQDDGYCYMEYKLLLQVIYIQETYKHYLKERTNIKGLVNYISFKAVRNVIAQLQASEE